MWTLGHWQCNHPWQCFFFRFLKRMIAFLPHNQLLQNELLNSQLMFSQKALMNLLQRRLQVQSDPISITSCYKMN